MQGRSPFCRDPCCELGGLGDWLPKLVQRQTAEAAAFVRRGGAAMVGREAAAIVRREAAAMVRREAAANTTQHQPAG